MNFTVADITGFVQSVLWPFLRAIGLFLIAPVFGAALVPARIKIILALLLAFLIAPMIAPAAPVEPIGARMLLMAANQILIGVAIGFIIQVIFEALSFAGQTVAMTMGLGYAMMVDPQRGASVPVVSQFMIVLGILLFLSMDGHLALIQILTDSFRWMPIGATADANWLSPDTARNVVTWGGQIFSAGLAIGLPAIVALIIVNLALGVVSRAAPSLNLFAIGFPVTLAAGFLVVLVTLRNLDESFADLLRSAIEAAAAILGGGGGRG